ncbi:MAG: ABC transporter ATP-binding protein [Kiritimatiellae bacterium]|nr:ABC transporter ATP-binding protein [Kiritimatiellia bacterium]
MNRQRSTTPGPPNARAATTFRARARYVWRALACLKPYWPLVLGAYAAVFASNGLAIWMPVVIRRIVDTGIRAGVARQIGAGCALLLGLALVRGLFTFLTGRWTEMASQNVAFDIRNRFHEKLQALSFSFHDAAETGQLLTRSVQDVDRIRFLTGRAFLHVIQMTTLIAGIAAAMLAMNARLGLITLSIFPFLITSAFILGGMLRPLSMQLRDKEGALTSYLEQNLRGAQIVKAFGREQAAVAGFGAHNRDLLDLQRREARLRAVYLPLMQLLAGAGMLLVLVFGGRQVIGGSLTLGELVAFTAYVAQLAHPGRRLGWIVAAIAQSAASAERIFEVLDLTAEIRDAPGAGALAGVKGRIRFDRVSFAYTRSRKVLDDVSFEVEPGEKVALLGGTGSGKSSVINLIPRFYDPTAGSVLIDGRDIRSVTIKSLRDHIGIVLQDTVLFASTVRENIAFGRPDATEEQIVAAAKAAYAHGFITELSDGYDSYIGEQGVTLSGGQKQRLSLARAILKDPEILILDDATSSVDTETEQHIQEALHRLMRNRTALIIAQRLSTVREADKVFVLDRGRIAAVGTRSGDETPHDQLLRTSGVYVDIYNRQLRPEGAE